MSNYQSKGQGQKRKRNVVVHQQGDDEVDTSKPSAVFTPTGGRLHTLSIALPGSVIANAQTHETKTLLAAQVARACAVFCVDEIVIFNDGQSKLSRPKKPSYDHRDEETGYTGFSDPDDFLYHVLSYLETPPHLRRTLFPMHPNLRTAGMMPSLDMPHHLRANEWCRYREGVTVTASSDDKAAQAQAQAQPQSSKKQRSGSGNGSATAKNEPVTMVDCGLSSRAIVSAADVPAGSRMTVKFATDTEPEMGWHSPLRAEAVSPDTPREEAGYYWGYSTRMAASLSAIFTECPYDGGYDVSFGTSERGVPVSSLLSANGEGEGEGGVAPVPKGWSHLILVFGGVAGLEVALKADRELTGKGVTEARDVFDYWVNLVPQQGSRTIRTEEAVWLGLMGLRGVVEQRQAV